MKMHCAACDGNGIGTGMQAAFGELMNLCSSCDGHGYHDTEQTERPFVAIWPVSARYAVRMKVPKTKGGFLELDIEWWPDLPAARGKKALTPSEKRAYDKGRNQALAVNMAQMGGGDFSVLQPKERH